MTEDSSNRKTARRMELLVSYVLRAGVLLGTALIMAGVVQMARTGETGYASVLPHGLAALLAFAPPGSAGHFPTAPGEILRAAVVGKPYAIIELGILVLIATPALRVALSVGFFHRGARSVLRGDHATGPGCPGRQFPAGRWLVTGHGHRGLWQSVSRGGMPVRHRKPVRTMLRPPPAESPATHNLEDRSIASQ